jgi:aspartate 1-decarboxylase
MWRCAVRITLLKGKIHRCTVTHADLDYEGSVTISEDLMAAAGIVEHEQVHVWNVTNGARVVTYAMRGDRGSGAICINGAAAHVIKPKDLVIIAAFASVDEGDVTDWRPAVVLVDAQNRIQTLSDHETAGPARRNLRASTFD